MAKLDKLNQARVNAHLRLPPDYQNQPIIFLVDTGSSNSCLLPDDVIRLGIDHSNLQSVTKTIVTANGPVNLKVIPKVEIVLPVLVGLLDNRRAYFNVPLDPMPVLPPGSNYKALPRDLVFSLLGMDILRHFPRWIFKKDRLVMENDEVVGLKLSFRL